MIFSEIAEVEVAIRSALANIVAEETGNIFWMTAASTYRNQDRFQKTMAIIDKELNGSQEEFIEHLKLADYNNSDKKCLVSSCTCMEQGKCDTANRTAQDVLTLDFVRTNNKAFLF